jgi:hypothetical protein
MNRGEGDTFSYLIDEGALSRQLGRDIPDPIRVFSLAGLGVDQDRFLRELGPTFADLPWDTYDLKLEQVHYLARCFPSQKRRLDDFYGDYHQNRMTLHDVADLLARLSPDRHRQFDLLEPFRRRSIARFRATRVDPLEPWTCERAVVQAFAQDVAEEDARSLKRIFEEASETVTSHPEFGRLLRSLAELVASFRPEALALSMTMHQVSIIADVDTLGDNSPEGIHKDGADYIVSALVVARDDITGGESLIYGPDRETRYVRIELKPGQGIFQADANSTLWHDVTPIRLSKRSTDGEGRRDIFGFDIDVVAP